MIIIYNKVKNYNKDKIYKKAITITKWIGRVVGIYALYLFVFGVLIFNFLPPKSTDYIEVNSVDRFYGDNEGQDRVILLENGYEAGARRITLINSAEQTIDISSYSFLDGEYTDIFFASVLQAADRGVQVRVLVDGAIINALSDSEEISYAFYSHPNIEFQVYEPISFLKPWVFNNRLHDKFMVVDNKWAIIGGRNIGDKYVDLGCQDRMSYDREVLLINTDEDNYHLSVIQEFTDYYNLLWDSEFVEPPVRRLTQRREQKGEEKVKELMEFMESQRMIHPDFFDPSLSWLEEDSFPTNNVTLIHNPLTRMNKEPWVWYEISRLMDASQESVVIQSPYIVPTNRLLSYLNMDNAPKEITILTNSLASNPNNFGLAGYMPYRKRIVDWADQVYEYQGTGSIHGKSFVFDNRVSLVGSVNVDPRSAFLSTETMAVIDSEEFATHLMENMGYLFDQSLVVSDDYTYIPDENVQERDVPIFRRTIVRILSGLTYFFRHML